MLPSTRSVALCDTSKSQDMLAGLERTIEPAMFICRRERGGIGWRDC